MRALCNHYQRRRQICDVLVPFFCSVILVPTNILMHNLGSFTMTTSIYAKYIFLARTNFMLCTCSFFSTDCILNNEILVRSGYSWTSASTLRSIFVIHFQLLPVPTRSDVILKNCTYIPCFCIDCTCCLNWYDRFHCSRCIVVFLTYHFKLVFFLLLFRNAEY